MAATAESSAEETSSTTILSPTIRSSDVPCQTVGNLPVPNPNNYDVKDPDGRTIVLGIEGSANKVGVGVVCYDPNDKTYSILSNPRKTYVAPTGQGFLPRETAQHHQAHVVALIRTALQEAFPNDHDCPQKRISAICFTKGPGMGGPLQSCAICARTLAVLWQIPLIPVNHCVAHVEMGRLACGVANPVVLYVLSIRTFFGPINIYVDAIISSW